MISILAIPIFVLSLCGAGIELARAQTSSHPVFQKGMTYVTWTKDGFSTKKSDESLKAMAGAGINYVAIVVTLYQRDFNSVEITPAEWSPSDKSVRHVIRKARELGMNVLLKPHIDLLSEDGTRSDIGFQTEKKWRAWLDSYLKFISRYARIAREEQAEIFCVGTELSFASMKEEMWKNDIIPAVRKLYPGKITYAANWDEYDRIEFWDDLDYAGINAYFSLSKKSNPAYGELKEGWKKWLGDIEKWQARVGKPVLFTEAGYCSADSAARKPWEEGRAGKANLRLQADCYKALFETFWHKSWFFGIYWWSWSTYPGSGGEWHRGFTPQNKLALNYLKKWYGMTIFEKTSALAPPLKNKK